MSQETVPLVLSFEKNETNTELNRLSIRWKWGERRVRKMKSEDVREDRVNWLERIMDEYGERLTKLAYNYVKDWKLSEDIVQEVFIICYNHYEKNDAIVSFKSWIFRITINKAKDILKSSGFRKVVMNSNVFAYFSSKDLPPEQDCLKRTEEEYLSKSVLALPVKYREVIILYYYEECAIDEIATMLGLNQNTIKTRISRGREKLKKMMERGGYDGEEA